VAASGQTSGRSTRSLPRGSEERTIRFESREGEIRGDLVIPPDAIGTVVFAHGSGSDRKSPRNRWVASQLHSSAIATLLLDLLTSAEEKTDRVTREFRFDIPRLAERLVSGIDAVVAQGGSSGRAVGLYGASTGGAAALMAAARRPEAVRAVVLRGARSDLAEEAIAHVRAPTLFLVGGMDPAIRQLNEVSCAQLTGVKQLVVVPGATHLFEETGALEEVADHARRWFLRYLPHPA
jgi:putative phosphoribosyl transferase